MPTLEDLIRALDSTGDMQDFASWAAPAGEDLQRVWADCPRGDWLLWLLGAVRLEHRLLVRAACECVRVAEVCVPSSEEAPRRVLAAADAWFEGHGSAADCLAAGDAARALASRLDLGDAVRAAADAASWLSRLVGRALPEPGAEGHALQGAGAGVASDACLALMQAAAASAYEVAPAGGSPSEWWSRCYEAARRRFADIVRACIPFDRVPPAVYAVAKQLPTEPRIRLPGPGRGDGLLPLVPSLARRSRFRGGLGGDFAPQNKEKTRAPVHY